MEPNKSPTILEQVKGLGEAVKNWTTKDGMRVVPPDILEVRKKLCLSCEHWDKDGFVGVGRCKLCGCSAAKLYIPSSFCPIYKWKAVFIQPADESGKENKGPEIVKEPFRKGLRIIGRTEPTGSQSSQITGSTVDQ